MGHPFKEFAKDLVKLLKEDGKEFLDIKASVQKNQILIFDSTLPIEEGDRLVRMLSNGLEESYIVTDRGFRQGLDSIGPYYKCEVQKESSMKYREWSLSNITNHFYGPNSRMNVGSTDNSTNINNVNHGSVFDELRAAITEGIHSKDDSRVLLELVDRMEETQGTPSFIEKYKNFMETAATHISVISPILPALTQLL
ncbi:hypothetical protein MKY29_12890 [Psychrobacillus sp. FSL K6-2365]|uniref:hypothetical protein n=1 Tax=Psychrobacillus sp. FSL K6-2365 TaxID=2921546 RepID=UPI0030F6F65C